MVIEQFPFQILDWTTVAKEKHKGDTGMAYWQTTYVGNIRVRLVEYSPGYTANHWCNKGHIIYCIQGSMVTALKDGREMHLLAGMSYFVGDNSDEHRSSSPEGCRLMIVD